MYRLKDQFHQTHPQFQPAKQTEVNFICGTELSCIYKHDGAVRRVHHCVFAPSLEVAEKINLRLAYLKCNLRADGRPIIGLSSQKLLETLLEIDERNVVVPAHIWTPWFAIFGSKSGYQSIEQCFGSLSKYIFAVETGLSSDPSMNWRLTQLDDVALISTSDAHSLRNLGREATLFEGKINSYDDIMAALRFGNPRAVAEGKGKSLSCRLAGTVEFFPDEGRYHFDGHRQCKVRFSPEQSKKVKGICPVCGRSLTLGVLYQVQELADRAKKPNGTLPFTSLIELDKVIAEAQGVKGRFTKVVEAEYWKLISMAGSEMSVLLESELDILRKVTTERVVEAIKRLREGKVSIEPGYDGEYGIIKIFDEQSRQQPGLF